MQQHSPYPPPDQGSPTPQGSPPLVPVPTDTDNDHPHDHARPRDPDPAAASAAAAYDAYASRRTHYDDRAAPPTAYYPGHQDDPYRAHYAAHPPAHPYHDPYGAPPPAAYPPHYPPRGPPPGYGAYPPAHPRDPYGAARDPYGRPAYGAYPPPRDPYGPPPPPHPDYYGRPPPPPLGAHDYYARPPPPAHAAASSGYGPSASARSSAEPVPPPVGPPPDPNDLSIPLLYLARSVSHKTFAPLRTQYTHLELRFVNSLLDLAADLHAVSLEHPNLLAGRRRVWITAVGGTDALVARVRATTDAVLDWREANDLATLERELAIEERRVVTVREEEAHRRAGRGDEGGQGRSSRDREAEEVEREKGRREIEERERDGGAQVPQSEPDELNEVLRAVRGESLSGPATAAAGLEGLSAPSGEAHEAGADGPRPPPASGATPQSPSRLSRKRSRHDDQADEDETEEIKELRRAERKKLEAVCKMARRRCVEASERDGVPVNDEARAADDEPQLGERHKGVWDLFSQPLDDISPQIQVLMARAMRDATYPPRLRLYDHPEALEQLEAAVPWFVTLVRTIKSRYELAAADPPAPLDPPLAGPFASVALDNGI
ncbi:hypothetical protein JCM9279_000864 [Rhodotorula babjevae]